MIRLTKNREEFVQNLIRGLTQRKAYRASFKCDKMSDKTVDEKASRLFADDKVRARYNEIRDKVVEEAEKECIIDAKELLREWKAIATSKVTDYLDIDIKPMEIVTMAGVIEVEKQQVLIKNTDDIDPKKIGAISSIKQGRNGIEIKLHNKEKALEFLSDYISLKDNSEENDTINKLDKILASLDEQAGDD